jgi:hypothetical protein
MLPNLGTIFGAFLVSSAAVNALPRAFLTARNSPQLPSEDPFYQPPSDFESKEPGTILRSRQLPGQLHAFNHFKENISDAYQLLYRTTDSHGDADASVTTILIPRNADNSKLLSYQIFEDSAEVNCAPSFSLQQGPSDPTDNRNPEIIYINAALSRGWYVSSPDYEGRNAAFTAGIKAGRATLDAIRAALMSGDVTGLGSDAKTVMWGYSGGSIPTQFAAQLQPTYAPELSDSLLGATAGGIIANLSATLETIDKTKYAGLGLGGLKGITQEYPAVENYVNQHLRDEKKDAFQHAGTLCLEPLEKEFTGESIFGFLENGKDILYETSLQSIFHDNIMGASTPAIPQFLYHSENDEVSPIKQVEQLVKTYCSNGGRITFHRDQESSHPILFLTAGPDAITWIADRFEGKPVSDGCEIRELTTSLESSGASEILGEVVAGNFERMVESERREAEKWWDDHMGGGEGEGVGGWLSGEESEVKSAFDDWLHD